MAALAFGLLPASGAQQISPPPLSVSIGTSNRIEISWPGDATSFVLEETGSLGSAADWQAVSALPVIRDALSVLGIVPGSSPRFYRLRHVQATSSFRIVDFVPADGANEVGVTYRPKITFSEPVNPISLVSETFAAMAAGAPLEANIVPANDGSFAWLFFKQPMPGSTVVRVTVDGSGIFSQTGELLDADGDGSPGGLRTFEFTTVSREVLPGTSLSGIVVDPGPDQIPRTADDVQPGPDGQVGTADDRFLLPIEGVKVFLLGREQETLTTGADGRFRFAAVPAGNIKVVVNGNTATRAPAGFYFPEMVLDAQMVPGITNAAMANGSEVYLPRLSQRILQTINASTTNVIKATIEGAPDLSAFQRNQLTIEVPRNSLVGANGQKPSSGQIGISTVPPDLVREMLPPGVLQHTFDITVQAPGIETFSTPAPMTFPNVFNAAPGTQLNFLSFDHTTGRLVIEGTATVSADGATVRTDVGTGITHPGWHGLTPPGGPNDPPCNPQLSHPLDVPPIPVTAGLTNHLMFQDGESFVFSFGNAAQTLTSAEPCDPFNALATPLVIKIDADGPFGRFLSGLPTTEIQLLPGQQRSIRISARSLANQLLSLRADQFYAALLRIKGYQFGKPNALLLDKTISVGRFLSVVNPDVPTEVQFLKTLADGQGNFVRTKNLDVHLPAGSSTSFSGPSSSSAFKLDAVANRDATIRFQFDPSVKGLQINHLTVNVGGYPFNRIPIVGQAIPPTTIGVGRSAFQQMLKAFLQNPRHFDGTPGVVQASANFKAVFHREGVLPSDNPSPALLDAIVSIVGSNVVNAVRKDFAPANVGGNGFVVVDDGGDVTLSWVAEHRVPTSVKPVFGDAEFDRDENELRAALTNKKRGLVYYTYAFCRDLNLKPDNMATFGFDIEAQSYASSTSFSTYVANTVSHELGHTFGLLDSYLSTKNATGQVIASKSVNPPGDIMRAADPRDGDLYFAPENFDTLRAAIGLAPNEAEDGVLDFAIALYMRNFNLDDSKIGLMRELAAEPFPHLDVQGLRHDLDGRYLFDAGTVLADGQGKQLVQLPLTLINDGTTTLTITNIHFADGGQGFSIRETSFPTNVLVVDDTLALTVVFDPARSGPAADTLTIETDQAESHCIIQLKGNGFSSTGVISIEFSEDTATANPQNNLAGVNVGGVPKKVAPFASIRNVGGGPLTVTAVKSLGEQFVIDGLPAQPFVIPPGQSQTFNLSFAPDRAGLIRGAVQILSSDADMPDFRAHVVGTGLAASGNPLDSLDYGNDYVALESPDFPNGAVLRAKSDDKGNFEFFLPPAQRYHGVIFDPASGLVAHLNGITAASGQNTPLGIPVFLASAAPDTDGDGLPDDAEFALGTDPHKADTDGNGIDDFTEVMQGRNPLGGRVAETGIIGRLATSRALNVTLVSPELNNPESLHAYVSDTSGMLIVDVAHPNTPALVGRLQVPGLPEDTAVDLTTRKAVVASPISPVGPFLVDISAPASPQLMKGFGFPATEVEALSGYAYAVSPAVTGTNAVVRSIDLVKQSLDQELRLPIRSVDHMTHEANVLYVLGERTLCIISVNGTAMTLRSQLAIPFGKGRMAVADGIAYIPYEGNTSTGVTGGYSTVDVSNPDQPRIIQLSQAPPGAATPGALVAVNGAGLALLGGTTGLGNPWVLDVMNAANPTNTYSFITRFPLTRAAPMAVSVAAGLAFVANDTEGLLIVNYVSADTRGQAPTVKRIDLLPDADPNTPGMQLIEGNDFHVRVGLSDDVQVRSVELLLDGIVVQRSVSFPLNLTAVAPQRAQQTNVVIQVRATDTGGNVTLSAPVTASVVFDSVPPVLLQSDPAEGETKGRGLRLARLLFSKPMAASASNIENYVLKRANGESLPIRSGVLRDADRTVELNFDRLEAGRYRLTLRQQTIRDRAGNPLGTTDLTTQFDVAPYSIRWVRTHNAGSWFHATNWIPARVPTAEDSVLIDIPGTNAPVTVFARPSFINAGIPQPISVRFLDSNEPLQLYQVHLHAEEFIRVNNNFNVVSGGLVDTLWLAGSNTLVNGASPFVLDNVRMEGDFVTAERDLKFFLLAPFDNVELDLRNTVTLNGSWSGRDTGDTIPRSFIRIPYTATLQGTGVVHHPVLAIGAPALAADPAAYQAEITIGRGITLRGLQNIALAGQQNRLINQGRIIFEEPFDLQTRGPRSIVSVAESSLFAGPMTNEFINAGSMVVRNGAEVWIQGSFNGRFVNQGELTVTDRGLLAVMAWWSSPKTICDTSAIFQLGGPLITPAGQISELSGPGQWMANRNAELASSRVVTLRTFGEDATFSTSPALATVRLVNGASMEGSVTFNDVAFEGELHNYNPNARPEQTARLAFGYQPTVAVRTNLTLNGSIIFHREPSDTIPGFLQWAGGLSGRSRHVLNGRGRIVFQAAGIPNELSADELTIGRDITIEANGVVFGSRFGPPLWSLHNMGAILVDSFGPDTRFNISFLTNSGTFRLSSSVVLTNRFPFVQTATGNLVIRASGNQPGVSHGQLKNVGQVTFDGAFVLEGQGQFLPKSGDVYELVTYGMRQGTFSSQVLPSPPAGLQWKVEYGSNSFRLNLGP
jgi:hypothetical protein